MSERVVRDCSRRCARLSALARGHYNEGKASAAAMAFCNRKRAGSCQAKIKPNEAGIEKPSISLMSVRSNDILKEIYYGGTDIKLPTMFLAIIPK